MEAIEQLVPINEKKYISKFFIYMASSWKSAI